ncbi:molybdopterin molybdotransferase MoeA [Sulfuracidifex tepidarius]|uniref:MoaB/Mog domain-containing protein n=1 Tax=Sulfuracidifex tepidarius TaxID=1294262 RepID=A0A510E301_9CREN|nr:molybdopterin molybdotransferase MoeA [Sulfuracidifex tepidarius]BBG26847.1 hypothetical protein IC007_1368 [Sulfuracidifex tepidarius]
MALISLEEARRLINDYSFNLRCKAKEMDVLRAGGRALARDLIATKNVPDKRLSAMDGYAVRYEDLKLGRLRISGKVFPDSVQPSLMPGEAYYVATGAPIPSGADTVVRVENSRTSEDGYVEFKGEVMRGKDIREVGEDAKEGDVILRRGEILTANKIGLVLTQGVKSIDVMDLQFSIFANGDELAPFYSDEGNRDIISPMVMEFLRPFGSSKYLGVARDNIEDVRSNILKGVEESDVVISIGGSSVGEKDFVKRVIREEGDLLFEGISTNVIKRGAMGAIKGKPVLVLPGQVVSAFLVLHELVFSLLSRFGVQRRKLKVKLGEELLVTHNMDSTFLFQIDGCYAKPMRWGVGLYSELAKANSYGYLKRLSHYRKGEEIELYLL